MNSLRPLILITPCFIPRLLWTCLRISYPRSYHAMIKVNGCLPLAKHMVYVFAAKYRVIFCDTKS
jgi:hypothetical protein